MVREQGPFKTDNAWPRIGWRIAVARTIASQLTARDMHAVAELYGIATPTRVAER
jgi:hypothetical protein